MDKHDTWKLGGAYEPYVGRWSRVVAREFLDWLAVPPGSDWLDVGSGTGAITETILQQTEPASVSGVDPAEGFVAYAREHVQDKRASFRVGNAMALPFADEAFDAVVAGLVLNFVPKQDVALAEMARVARPGGIVGAYVWDYAEGMQMMRIFWDAAVELDPAVADLDEGPRFPICQPGPLADALNSAGLRDVQVRAIDINTYFRDFDEYWTPFLGGQGSAPGYAMSLTEEQRRALRDLIRSKIPTAQDGSISLIARVWAARGTR
ncbi:MAG: methyltransferase domain-containing protein [Chloroflexota bacterium]